MKPRPFEGEVAPYFREGTLVTDGQNRVGYLREIESLQPMFHPLELTPAQRTKASMYIEIRDAYYHLYNNEAETLTANPALREMLNRLYDNFTERFGRLNDKRNLDLIKMDARGTEILSLERYIDGKARKADIFERPVAFNPDEITHADDASEALVASLNKYGRVEPHYMASLTGTTVEGILGELKGRIYSTRKRTATRLPTSSSPAMSSGKPNGSRRSCGRIPTTPRPGNRWRLCARRRPNPSLSTTWISTWANGGFQKVFTSVSPPRSSIRR